MVALRFRAMTISELLLPEFDNEMSSTRKLLERVSLDSGDWEPHAKSMSMRRLASHVAEIPKWGVDIVKLDSLDIPPGQKPFQANSSKELMERFESKSGEAREAIAGASDEHLKKLWTVSFGERVVFNRPRYELLRTMMMNHLIHHRGQLSVYLRLKDIPVPGMYGPSADEK